MVEKKISVMADPNLIGKHIYLRPATAEDVANTYHWFLLCDPALQMSRPHPMRTAAEAADDYRKMERSAERQLFVMARLKDKQPVGVIRFFNWNYHNRSAELGMLVDPDEHRKGYGLEAIRVLTRYLFRVRDLNKVHALTSSLNTAAVGMMEKAGFKRDATLRNHYYYNGEFHDGYIYSLLRFEFDR